MHIDMDCFFVSVERLYDARLIGRPVAVTTDNRRSVVSSASYEARKYGVRSAMPTVRAKQQCAELLIVEPHMERYQAVSRRVFEIFERFTPLVERLGIDEGFLDVTGSLKLFGEPRHIAEQIRSTVWQELGVPCSVGIGPNKFIAKIASVKAKPDGVYEVPAAVALHFLHQLPVTEVYGVGPKTVQKLNARAIHTVADLYQTPHSSLVRLVGKAMGDKLYQLARGVDEREIEISRDPKSISNESTFEYDTNDLAEITAAISFLSQKVARRLRKAGMQAGSIGVNVRWQDFTSGGTHLSLAQPTNSTQVIYNTAMQLVTQFLTEGRKVRLLGVSTGKLVKENTAALPLWEEDNQRWHSIDVVADQIAEKYGSAPITTARLLESTQQQAEENQNSFGNRGHAGGFRIID